MNTYRIVPADFKQGHPFILQKLRTKRFLWWSWESWDTLCGSLGGTYPLQFHSVGEARSHLTRNRHLVPGDVVWETNPFEEPSLP